MRIRWAALRAFEGWAALQHHTLLHTRITVFPPSKPSAQVAAVREPVRLLVDIQQGSFFTVLPSQDEGSGEATPQTPKWWAGNIYAINASPPQAVPLPTTPSETSPTTYDLFVSGDYEVCLQMCLSWVRAESVQIRLFGDPGTNIPKLIVAINVDVDRSNAPLDLSPDHNIVPDFVDGWTFGRAIGIGLRSSKGWWTVTDVALADSLVSEVRFVQSQSSLVYLRLPGTRGCYLKEDGTCTNSDPNDSYYPHPIRTV